jgi:4-aminobutyrate aminotransferase-like enzyme
MNITLTLDPEVEKGLLARAQQRGLTLNAYLEDLVKKEVALADTRRSGKEKAQAFVAWAKSHRSTKPLSDEAISRARLYPDRP